MSKDEALKLALEALEDSEDQLAKPYSTDVRRAITAIKEALAQPEQEQSGFFSREAMKAHSDFHVAQPEQEPVAWTEQRFFDDGTPNPCSSLKWAGRNDQDDFPVGTKFYTTPPQRTWVGLTDDEIDQGLLRSDYAFKTAEAWRAGVVFAMTKLKEMNK